MQQLCNDRINLTSPKSLVQSTNLPSPERTFSGLSGALQLVSCTAQRPFREEVYGIAVLACTALLLRAPAWLRNLQAEAQAASELKDASFSSCALLLESLTDYGTMILCQKRSKCSPAVPEPPFASVGLSLALDGFKRKSGHSLQTPTAAMTSFQGNGGGY